MTFIPEVLTNNDANNSTTSSLLANGTFTGTATSTTGYSTIILYIKSNVNSIAGGIEIHFSNDNVTYDMIYNDTYFASAPFIKVYNIMKRYYKIIYKNDGTNQTSFEISSRLSINSNNSSTTNSSVTIFDNSVENTLDAFGKLRVSHPETLLDIRYPSNSVASGASASFRKNHIQVASLSSGSYSAVYEKSKAVISGSGAGYYMTQSRNYCIYQPGKSLLFMASGIINPGNSAYTARIGYYDSEFTTNPSVPTVNNGIYFEYSSGVASVNLKNDTLRSVSQNSWNVDKMDGTGPSGLTLDFTKTQLFIMDMEWLGVGRVRFGFYAYGRIQYVHQFTNINQLAEPYTNSINLPISYTLIGTTGVGSITQICTTVISEGGYSPSGRPFSVSNSQTGTDLPVTVGTTEVPLIAIRGGGANYYHQNIVPTGISIIDTATNNNLLYRLRIYSDNSFGGTITWTSVDTNDSVVEYALSADITGFTTTNSRLLDQGYFYGRGTIAFNGLGDIFSNLILQLTANILNEADVLILTCEKVGTSSTTVYATLSWQEIY